MGFLLFNSTSQVGDLYVVVYLFIFIMGLISEKSLEVKVFIPIVFMNFRGNQTDNGFFFFWCMMLFFLSDPSLCMWNFNLFVGCI